MEIVTGDGRPNVKLVTAESLDDAVFEAPSPDGKIHSSLDCPSLSGVDTVFGYTGEVTEVTCSNCLDQ